MRVCGVSCVKNATKVRVRVCLPKFTPKSKSTCVWRPHQYHSYSLSCSRLQSSHSIGSSAIKMALSLFAVAPTTLRFRGDGMFNALNKWRRLAYVEQTFMKTSAMAVFSHQTLVLFFFCIALN